MNKLELIIPIAPVAWQRVKRGKYGQAYVPAKTRSFEDAVGMFVKTYRTGPPMQGPLILTARFYIEWPKKRVRPYPSVRPDLDNYMKALKDGLVGVLMEDDSQVCQYGPTTGKYYCTIPRIEICLERMVLL